MISALAHTAVCVPDVAAAADVAGLRTTWFRDPWGVTFILVEKSRQERPYYAQWG